MAVTLDAVVVGLGAMGSAAAFHLARRGLRVAAFDRFRPPHAWGSSHGDTRIIREAYFEHPVYVPMVQRAYELWVELEQHTETTLYVCTGGLMIGAPDSVLVSGTLHSVREHRLAHELLRAVDLRARFPALDVPSGMIGVLEPRAGVLFAEVCVRAHLDAARRAGADLHLDDPVLRWHEHADDVTVHAASGRYHAKAMVVSAGAWVTTLLPAFPLPFTVERQTLYWFDPARATDVFSAQRCPIHLWQFEDGQFFYGFPDLGDGVKVARHHRGRMVDPDRVDRNISQAEIDDIRALVRRFVPAADGTLRKSAVCLYTNTPDEHFWIDSPAGFPQVLIVSPCSGHGFKFAPAIGEIVANWLTGTPQRFDLGLFRRR